MLVPLSRDWQKVRTPDHGLLLYQVTEPGGGSSFHNGRLFTEEDTCRMHNFWQFRLLLIGEAAIYLNKSLKEMPKVQGFRKIKQKQLNNWQNVFIMVPVHFLMLRRK